MKIEIPDKYSPYKADKKSYAGLSSVDFIAETPNEFLLIEVKNLDNPAIPKDLANVEKSKFLIKTEKTRCNDCSLYKTCPKCNRIEFVCEISFNFKDTILNELAKGRTFDKPIVCILLLEYYDYNLQRRRILYQNISERIPKFTETDYRIIHSVKFELCDKEIIMEKYADIKVENYV